MKGLATYYTLFAIDISSRRVHIVGSTPHPNALFMKQAALDLAAFEDGAARHDIRAFSVRLLRL